MHIQNAALFSQRFLSKRLVTLRYVLYVIQKYDNIFATLRIFCTSMSGFHSTICSIRRFNTCLRRVIGITLSRLCSFKYYSEILNFLGFWNPAVRYTRSVYIVTFKKEFKIQLRRLAEMLRIATFSNSYFRNNLRTVLRSNSCLF